MTEQTFERQLRQSSPELEALLTAPPAPAPRFAEHEISLTTVRVTMRDGIRLASDLYLPPKLPAPVLVARTPYGRARRAPVCTRFAQSGYAVVSQDCRGTGESEPEEWEYYIFEPEDSVDLVNWILQQPWCDGFVGGFGGSYAASTQWCMAAHPHMSTIVPEVGGLGVTFETARLYMFLNAYAKTIGKGTDHVQAPLDELERQMLPETLAGGLYDEVLPAPTDEGRILSPTCTLMRRQRVWQRLCELPPSRRLRLMKKALATPRFTYVEMERLCTGPGLGIAYGAHSIPSATPAQLVERIRAPALLVTGWYDWNLNDVLASFRALSASPHASVRLRSRLLVTPSAHNTVGYKEGAADHPELNRSLRTPNLVEVLMRWYDASQAAETDAWPTVIYYLMGANTWLTASDWPPLDAHPQSLYLRSRGALCPHPPEDTSCADVYTYDPRDPTPTLGGSIVSHVYVPGSVDVSAAQARSDVLTYTTPALVHPLDVVGPLRLILYASSSALDTDFSARLTDVFPDGRAIQLQSGMLRARYRRLNGSAEPLVPGEIYRFEIDMWATANRFEVGHRLRLDISSADFPRYDRNSNAGGTHADRTSPAPVPAVQTVYHERAHPSELHLSVLGTQRLWKYFGFESERASPTHAPGDASLALRA